MRRNIIDDEIDRDGERGNGNSRCDDLGVDGAAYRRLVTPFVDRAHDLLHDALAPLKIPRNPFLMLRFGLRAFRSATGLANGLFDGARAKALFAGCAAHSILPLERSESVV